MAKKQSRQLTAGWAIYLRTSTEESQAPERSQESQRRVINQQLIANSDLDVIEEYADIYSGRKTDRQNYQRLLEDAQQGKFSHVAVYTIDRFGRNDVECGRAFDELAELNITVKISSYPDLDLSNAAGRMIVGLMAAVARFESDRNSERTIQGMLTKLLDGGWPFRTPDGYINVEERAGTGDRKNARYRRWVEPHPEQAKMWRRAWDLLLEDRLPLKDICEDLHQQGYRLQSGAPLVRINEKGHRKPNTGALSRAFHNWFYAGWIVIDNDWVKVAPKQVEGAWEPIVSTEEFERGLQILERRNKCRDQKSKHFYLLTSLLYLEEDGMAYRMTGSTPRANRKGGATGYYRADTRPASINIPCATIDTQLINHLLHIQVEQQYLPALREVYSEHIEQHMEGKTDVQTTLTNALTRIDQEEERTARLFAAGRISEHIWNNLWAGWNAERVKLTAALDAAGSEKEVHIDNLDSAIRLLTKIGILFKKLAPQKQKFLLKQIIKRVVINREGMIIKVELYSPFTYLHALAKMCQMNRDGSENKKSSELGLDVSKDVALGVPTFSYIEHLSQPAQAVFLYFESISYPQRAEQHRFLAIS